MLFNGSSGVPKDYAAAAKSFAEVIRAVERDSTHAARSARRFDEVEHTEALFMLGFAHVVGLGVPENRDRARELLLCAVNAGHHTALAVCAVHGLGVLSSAHQRGALHEAIGPLQREADKGNPISKQYLGMICGLRPFGGTDEQMPKMVHLVREAASLGLATAQWCLGAFYGSGCGVRYHAGKAARWYGMAAAQGFDLARRSLRELEYREQSRFEELTSFGEGGWRGLLASE